MPAPTRRLGRGPRLRRALGLLAAALMAVPVSLAATTAPAAAEDYVPTGQVFPAPTPLFASDLEGRVVDAAFFPQAVGRTPFWAGPPGSRVTNFLPPGLPYSLRPVGLGRTCPEEPLLMRSAYRQPSGPSQSGEFFDMSRCYAVGFDANINKDIPPLPAGYIANPVAYSLDGTQELTFQRWEFDGAAVQRTACGTGDAGVVKVVSSDGGYPLRGDPMPDFEFGVGVQTIVDWRASHFPPLRAVYAPVQVLAADGTVLVPDVSAPLLAMPAPADCQEFSRGEVARASYSCEDMRGSGLASCEGTVANGAPIDTSRPGTHEFTVTGTDLAGNSRSRTVSYTVTGPPPPRAAVTSAAQGLEGQETQITGLVDLGFDGPYAPEDDGTVEVSWGDGTTSTVPYTAGRPWLALHTYADDGLFPLAATATDGRGTTGPTSTDDFRIGVDALAPTVTLTATTPSGRVLDPSVPLAPGSRVEVLLTGDDSGLLDPLSGSLAWGDGTSTPLVEARGVSRYSHVYSATGLPTISATIADEDGLAATASLDLQVEDPAEVLRGAAAVLTAAGDAMSGSGKDQLTKAVEKLVGKPADGGAGGAVGELDKGKHKEALHALRQAQEAVDAARAGGAPSSVLAAQERVAQLALTIGEIRTDVLAARAATETGGKAEDSAGRVGDASALLRQAAVDLRSGEWTLATRRSEDAVHRLG